MKELKRLHSEAKSRMKSDKLLRLLSSLTILERVEDHLENPVAVLNMVWRLARLWPRKIKALLAHQVLAFKDFRYINHDILLAISASTKR